MGMVFAFSIVNFAHASKVIVFLTSATPILVWGVEPWRCYQAKGISNEDHLFDVYTELWAYTFLYPVESQRSKESGPH
jgi:hypothetical protein